MKVFLGRLISWLASAGFWVLLGARTVLDLIGYATVPDDAKVAASRLDQFFLWVLGIPWWAVLGFALFSTMWVAWLSWPHSHTEKSAATGDSVLEPEKNVSSIDNLNSGDPFLDATSGDAHERLELFVVDHIQPALYFQFELQKLLLKRLCHSEKVLHFAEIGLRTDYMHYVFSENAERLMEYGQSPMPVTTVEQMVNAITALENQTYWRFCEQAKELAAEAGVAIHSDPEIFDIWSKWREAHNGLVESYNALKRESRFPKPLYRPQLASRWGGIVAEPSQDETIALQLPPGIEEKTQR